MCFVCFRVFHMGTHGTDNPVVDRVLCPCVYPCVSGGPPIRGDPQHMVHMAHTSHRICHFRMVITSPISKSCFSWLPLLSVPHVSLNFGLLIFNLTASLSSAVFTRSSA